MAKGSNNIRGRTSDASKPYDVSNSFVKRVASRVTELLPQPSSWLSRWMSPASVPDINDYAGHSLSSTISSRQPATSRADLNLVDNVDHHIPAKKPRTSQYNSAVNQSKSLKNDVYSTEEISPIAVRGEPVAGPSSSHPEFIASTPAVHSQQQNSSKVNGDDCSETSESTSGCSSLVPQAQSTIRSLGGNRYGRKLPPGFNMDSLHMRRPSFSTTTFTSPLRASMRDRLGSSPFYSGRTMYGGSSQAYLSAVHSPQRRVGPTVKPMPAQQSLPLSSTAKRILDALEQFSTPVMDAKRMPVVVGSKRKLESSNQRYMELSIPSTPDLLRVKRRERLQQSTTAARQTMTASLPTSQSPVEYSIRKEDVDTKKHPGKVKRKEKVPDEAVAQVKLPSVVLSVDNLPKIDIAIPPPPPAHDISSTRSTTSSHKFMFAFPTTVPHSGNLVSSIDIPTSSFKFSAPIGETSVSANLNKPVVSNSVSSLSRTFIGSLTSDQKRHLNKDDNSAEPSVNPVNDSGMDTLKKLENNSALIKPSTSVTSVSNMQTDIKISKCKNCHTQMVNSSTPCSSCQKTQSKINSNDKIVNITNYWECSSCKKSNPSSSEDCISCHSKKQLKSLDVTKNNIKSPKPSGFENLYKPPIGTWECSKCMIQNKNEATKCVACEAVKPVIKEKSNTTTVASGFDNKFKKPSGSWECQSCLVINKPDISKCVACETPKPDNKSSNLPKSEPIIEDVKQNNNGFGNMFKKAPGSWTCNSCMVTNDAEKIKCVACETIKPGAPLPKTMESSAPTFSFGILPTVVPSSNSGAVTTFSFGIPKDVQASTAPALFDMPKTNFGIDNPKVSETLKTYSFGIPKTTKTDNTGETGVASSSSSKPHLSAGIPTQLNATESKLSFGSSVQNKQNVTKNIFGSTVVTPDTSKELAQVESTKPEISTCNSTPVTVQPSISSTVTPTFGIKNEKCSSGPEKTSIIAPLFTFGPNKVTPNTSDNKLRETNLPSKTSQPSFMFGTKGDNFGSNIASSTTSTISSSSPSSVFKFGETKTVSSSGDMSSISSVNTQSSFVTPKTNSIFSFGSNNEKKEVNFGSTAIKETPSTTVSLPENESKPTFGTFGATPNPSPAFGSTNVFGNGNFGNKEQPQNPFVPQTTPNVPSASTFSGFGQNNTFPTIAQENKPSAVFTFGSASSKEPVTAGGFVFNPMTEKRSESHSFGFATTQTNPPAQAFGFNATSSAPSAPFNFEPKPFGSGISPFPAASDATPVFGAPTSQQPPTFGDQANPSPVFAFGSQPAQPSQTPANPMFEFPSNQQQGTTIAPAPSTAFVFGTTPAPPATPAFDPNIKPTFNFTQGSSTPVFSAIPIVNSTSTPQPQNRKIRKAVRRTNISSVRQT